MKKIISILLCMVLLVSCGNNTPGEPAEEPEATTTTPEATTTTPKPAATTPKPTTTTPPVTTTEPPVTTTAAPRPEVNFDERLAALEPRQPRDSEIINRYYPFTVEEFIPADYGKLYPYRATPDGLYGFMTADGRIVTDGIFLDQYLHYIDLDGGYYYTMRSRPGDGIISMYMTADGSRTLTLPDEISYSAFVDKGVLRVFEDRGEGWTGTEWDFDRYTGLMDFNGKLISPMVSENEYALLYFGGDQYPDTLYVHKKTGEYFDFFHIPSYSNAFNQTYQFPLDYVRINKAGEVEARFSEPVSWYSRGIVSKNVSLRLGKNILISEAEDYRDNAVKLVNSSGKTLMEFPEGVEFHGDYFEDRVTNKVYDYNLKEITVEGYPYMEQYLRKNVFIFRDTEKDERDTKYYIIDVKTGIGMDYPSSWGFEAAPGKYIYDNTIYDLNTGKTKQFFPDYPYMNTRRDGDYLIVEIRPENSRDYFFGLYTLDGEELLPHEYDNIKYIADGLFEVWQNGFFGVINTDGEWLVKIDSLRFND